MTARRPLLFALTLLPVLGLRSGAPAQEPARAEDAPARARLLQPDGTPTDPAFFPIAVWLQDPRNATRYQRAGINLYVGLWEGPTETQLAALRAAGMPVVCDQNEVALEHIQDPIIAAWMHGDEPDNAQPVTDAKTGARRYGPPVAPARVVADYRRLRDRDPTRPVLLNLGQGVANDAWVGRGPDASPGDYPEYVKGADIVSFDVYPVAGLGSPDRLWLVPLGLERLARWTGGRKVLWNCVECTRISRLESKPTPAQVEAEVWMALAAGSRGLVYFVHQFRPSFDEDALLADPEMLAAVTALNRRIQALAPVLNSPMLTEVGSVQSAEPDAGIALRVHRHGGAIWVLAANLSPAATRGSFELSGLGDPASAAAVLAEDRSLPVESGRFEDEFAPFGAHLYRIGPGR